jgi:hypothetical protein
MMRQQRHAPGTTNLGGADEQRKVGGDGGYILHCRQDLASLQSADQHTSCRGTMG